MKNTAKRSRQRERLIAQMLVQPTLEKAAEAAGMSTITAWRIRRTPEFEREFHLAARRAHQHASARTQYFSGAAVSVLVRTMMDASAPYPSRVRAAVEITHHAQRVADHEPVDDRGEGAGDNSGVDMSRLTDEQLMTARELALAARQDHDDK